MNSIEFPEMNYKHYREKNAKFHIFLLLSIMGGISLITIYDRKFRHNRPEEESVDDLALYPKNLKMSVIVFF